MIDLALLYLSTEVHLTAPASAFSARFPAKIVAISGDAGTR
jgi:hypothetical protein